jgi:hypothetical protein
MALDLGAAAWLAGFLLERRISAVVSPPGSAIGGVGYIK